jgi:hypothetical protein
VGGSYTGGGSLQSVVVEQNPLSEPLPVDWPAQYGKPPVVPPVDVPLQSASLKCHEVYALKSGAHTVRMWSEPYGEQLPS